MSLKTLVPWNRGLLREDAGVVDPFTALQNEVNRTFASFFAGRDGTEWPGPNWPGLNGGLTPKLDVAETDQEFQLTMELPGMTEADIDVELLEDGVKVCGEKKDERETKDRNYHRMERTFGRFERFVPLSKPVNREAVAATFRNGVLNVVLPKAEPAQTHQKIAVQAG